MNAGRKLLAVCCIGLPFAAGCNAEYSNGYDQGVKQVREMRKKDPDTEHNLKATAEYAEIRDKSGDWNAGYRAGLKDELDEH